MAVVAVRLGEWEEERAVRAFDGSDGYEEGYEHGGTLLLAGKGVVLRVEAVDCHVASPPRPPPRPPPSPPPPPPDPPLLWWVHVATADHDPIDDDIFDASAGTIIREEDDAPLTIGTRPSSTSEQLRHKFGSLSPGVQRLLALGGIAVGCALLGMLLGCLAWISRRACDTRCSTATRSAKGQRVRRAAAGSGASSRLPRKSGTKHTRLPTREVDAEMAHAVV